MSIVLVDAIVALLAGLIAGAADYSLGLGYGLVATPILVYALGVDPRVAISSALAAQVVASLPAYIANRRFLRPTGSGRLAGPVVMVAGASLGMAASSIYYSVIDRRAVLAIYTVSVLILIALVLANARGASQVPGVLGGSVKSRYLKLFLGGFLAGAGKGLAGGGFSPIIVAVQKIAGVGVKDAIASIPLIKPVPFVAAFTIYLYTGFVDPWLIACLTMGTALGAVVAPRILALAPEGAITLVLLVVLGLSLARGVASLLGLV